jgi:hypothetical protein
MNDPLTLTESGGACDGSHHAGAVARGQSSRGSAPEDAEIGQAVMPPSITMIEPVMYRASSEPR